MGVVVDDLFNCVIMVVGLIFDHQAKLKSIEITKEVIDALN